jgi:hypothetical protein
MPSRLNYISKKRSDNKNYYLNLKYPEIPLSINDLYITTTSGDRLDTLANEFLNDVDLWWIITTANPDVIRRDSFNLKPGIEIRIPNNIQGAIQEFEALNK